MAVHDSDVGLPTQLLVGEQGQQELSEICALLMKTACCWVWVWVGVGYLTQSLGMMTADFKTAETDCFFFRKLKESDKRVKGK